MISMRECVAESNESHSISIVPNRGFIFNSNSNGSGTVNSYFNLLMLNTLLTHSDLTAIDNGFLQRQLSHSSDYI